MRRVAVALLVLLVSVAGAAARPECALACSCLPIDLDLALERADAAFVGRLLERRDTRQGPLLSSADPVTLVFAVERVHKGELGRRVEVVTAAHGASCGLEVAVGSDVGLFLDRREDAWTSGLCSQVTPDQLASAGWTGYAPLDSPRDGEEATSAFLRTSLLFLGAGVLLVGGLFLIRRKLRPE